MDEATDGDVIAASMGDGAAFGAIFDRHATVMFRYFVRRVGPDHADRLLGDLFRVAFERRHSFDLAYPSARPWLYGIATNLLAQHRRAEARRLRAMARLVAERQPEAGADMAEGVAIRVDAAAAWPRVADLVGSLPDGERDALLLFAWEGLSYEDIAASLGIPVGTVRSRLNRARRRLHELAPGYGEQPSTPGGGRAARMGIES